MVISLEWAFAPFTAYLALILHLHRLLAFVAFAVTSFLRGRGKQCMVLTEEAFNWLVSLSLPELFTFLIWIPVIIRARVFDLELDYQELRRSLNPTYYARRVRPRRDQSGGSSSTR